MTTTTVPNLREIVQEQLEDLVAIRHDLHRHPELGYEEKRTSEVVQRELEGAGVEFARNLAGGGLHKIFDEMPDPIAGTFIRTALRPG